MFKQENVTPTNDSAGANDSGDFDVKSMGRTEAFSDGVFAIAITLLVLDVRLPSDTEEMSGAELWSTLLHLWPQYLALVISFFFIGIMWINHHRVLSLLHRSTTALQLVNLVLLFVITALPFPTSVVAEHLGTPGEQVAGLFYNGFFVVIALIFNLFWRFVRGNDYLHKAGDNRQMITQISNQYRFGPLLYAAVFLVGIVSVPLALALQLLLAVFYALPSFRRSVQSKAGAV